ncbi:helix-turn-helix domain-containing protein [Peribacillus frigoritolerans]|uniref:helix-turn-helix domain-containing protein n=1 Tax=Peribacillus frigoritolerans TaxID=450367 RepID=UPI0010595EC0|nr:helix-turn-helix transcriptional regulator [Peribacillus frigoritolerans]TDL74239.1 XRE family transcriptional regulator [Peribacillus frigoritolerans]
MAYFFGTRLANARDKKRLTQKAIAEKLRISPSTWSQYESSRKDPSLANFKAICEELDVSADYLLGFTKNYKPLKGEEKC